MDIIVTTPKSQIENAKKEAYEFLRRRANYAGNRQPESLEVIKA